MDARQAEEMANSMLLNSPLPSLEKSDEKLPEEEGIMKLPEEGGGEKLPEETPTGKLIMPCTDRIVPFSLRLALQYFFPLDSQNPGNTVEKVDEVPQKAISVVQATTSQVLSGSAVPQEKLKLAFKLLGASSRVSRVLVFLDRVVYTDPLFLYFLAGGVGIGDQPAPRQFRAKCSERAGEEALVREGCPSREDQKTLQGQKRLVFSIYDAIN